MGFTGKNAFDEILSLKSKIKNVIDKFEYGGDNIYYDDDPDNNMYVSECHSLLNKLEDVYRDMTYLSKPIKDEGILKLREDGRYGFENDTYFTSGSSIEILIEDDDRPLWVATRIEHNGEDYYAVRLGLNVSLEGRRARYR